jgi:hypothetical protein
MKQSLDQQQREMDAKWKAFEREKQQWEEQYGERRRSLENQKESVHFFNITSFFRKFGFFFVVVVLEKYTSSVVQKVFVVAAVLEKYTSSVVQKVFVVAAVLEKYTSSVVQKVFIVVVVFNH